jgi:RecA/RadA recombinase
MQTRIKPHSFMFFFFGCVLHIEIGFQQGRVVEIFGPEASGKTTLALHVIAEAQKQGGYFLNAYKIYFNSYGSSS